jgi:glutamate racemase
MQSLRVAIIDSGKGGRFLFEKLSAQFPEISFFCETDEKNVPYGEKTPEQLLTLGSDLVQRALNHSPDVIIVACHTLCSWSFIELQKETHTPLWSVNKLLLQELIQLPEKTTITLWATPKTVESHWFEDELSSARSDLSVEIHACPGLATAIENENHEDIATLVSTFLAKNNSEVLALACTHYPVIRETIATLFPRTILDVHGVLSTKIEQMLAAK